MLGPGRDGGRRTTRQMVAAPLLAFGVLTGGIANAQDTGAPGSSAPDSTASADAAPTSASVTSTTLKAAADGGAVTPGDQPAASAAPPAPPTPTTAQVATASLTATATTVAPPTAATAAVVAAATSDTSPVGCWISQPLQYGDRGDAVRCLQLAINLERTQDLTVDGIFGNTTRASVRDFQVANGLPITGAVDTATAQRYGIWRDPPPSTTPTTPPASTPAPTPSGPPPTATPTTPSRPNPTPPPATAAPISPVGCWINQTLQYGQTSASVRCLQLAINRDRAADIPVTGYFGSLTRAAVRDFQSAVGLPVTGIVDAATGQRYRIWNGAAPSASPPPAAAPTPARPSGNTFGLPANSGTGRRVVYHRGQQRVWAVDAAGNVVKTHRVSGRLREPYRGTYSVYSRSLYTHMVGNPSVKWRYMVRFAYGPNGGRIGFHEIPKRFGVPLQSVSQLGQPLSGGCVRQSTPDAQWMWNWAGVGTKVVVI